MVVVWPCIQVRRWVDNVLDTIHEERPRFADIEQPFHAQDVCATRGEQHRQPETKRRPLEGLVEHEANGIDVVSVRTRLRRHLAQVDLWPVEARQPGSTSPKGASTIAAVGFSLRSSIVSSPASARYVFVTTSLSATTTMLHRLRLSEAMHRIDRRDHVLEGVDMLTCGSEMKLPTTGAGSASPVVSITTCSKGGTCARSRLRARSRSQSTRKSLDSAADTSAREHDCALVDLPDEVVIERNLTELVDDHRGVARVRMGQEPGDERRLPASEEAGDESNRQPLSQARSPDPGQADRAADLRAGLPLPTRPPGFRRQPTHRCRP